MKKIVIPLVLVGILGIGCGLYFLPNRETKESMATALGEAIEHRVWSSEPQTVEKAASLPSEEVDCLVALWVAPDGPSKAWYQNGRTQAHLQTDLVCQSVLITGSSAGYTLRWGCDRDHYDADLTRAGETWTVENDLVDNLDAQTGCEEVDAILSQAREQAQTGRLSAEKQALLERIDAAEALCTTYPTWEAALAAAGTLDLDGLNVFALA